ncbi:MAG: hypothetical protein H0T62_03700 [Parachlamydiaceae bacterium]|nr:hypothetical protein [Parachlamydiaceae bacterium]
MSIGQLFNDFTSEIKRCYEDLVNVKCYNNLTSMSLEMLVPTVFKISAIAFVVGITLGLICGSGIVGVLSAAIAFAGVTIYYTSDEQYKLIVNAKRSVDFNKISNDMAKELNLLNSSKK